MHLGFGLYKSLLNEQNFRFASQAGATHLVVQLVDYIQGDDQPSLTGNYLAGWGRTDNENNLWTYDDLARLKSSINDHGLVLEAIENIDPSHWYDILLDGPKKHLQLENLKRLIQYLGKLQIPILGYYFSIAGVWGWTSGPAGRGKAASIVFDGSKLDLQEEIPHGMVWNMRYQDGDGTAISSISREEIWQRYKYFLEQMLPVAEENSVRLVAHPDDPPVTPLRKTARLFTTIEDYEKLLDISSSPASGFECCLGTLQEMKKEGKDVYQFVDEQSAAQRIGYIHFRNVIGTVPNYREAFADEGDLDMNRIVGILRRNNYQGVLIPDHTPEMSCQAPWHAGMAYAMGYLKGLLQSNLSH